MALVEKYHVVAAVRPVAALQTIKEGQVVSLNTSGQVVLQDGGTYTKIPYGIAGDTKSTTASSMPGIASGWQNRVSDYFDETKASAKMTVYHSGGEFATDMYNSNVASLGVVMCALYGNLGQLDTHDEYSSGVIVGRLTQIPGAYPSGVPGTDVNGDIRLGGENTNTYIEFKLAI